MPVYCRKTLNGTLGAIKMIFRFAVSEELCAPAAPPPLMQFQDCGPGRPLCGKAWCGPRFPTRC